MLAGMLAGCGGDETDRYRYTVAAQRFSSSDTIIVYCGDRMEDRGRLVALYSDAATVTIDTAVFRSLRIFDRQAGKYIRRAEATQ